MAAAPFAIKRIDHIVLRVVDPVRAERFYREVLGCEVAKRRNDLGLLHLHAGASMIDLVAIDGELGRKGGIAAGSQGRNLDHLCLRIEHFDEAAIVAHLARHGITAHGPASTNFGAEGHGRSLYFDDPDGNTIELKGGSR
ncbi:MAG: VOC family protein [Pseudomonadota bacterium]|nr:VOC family protein [Pseudomonadota bacterium]